jgi:hypothetical protein
MSRLRTARQTVYEITPLLSISTLRERKANLMLIERLREYQRCQETLGYERTQERVCTIRIREFSETCVARMENGLSSASRLCLNELFRQRLHELLSAAKTKRLNAQEKCKEAQLAFALAQTALFKLQEKNEMLGLKASKAGAALREHSAELQIEEWAEMRGTNS